MTALSTQSIAVLAASHPCYTAAAAHRFGRLHLAVAPACNLSCNYCERVVGVRAAEAGGPGSADRVLSVEEAVARVAAIESRGWLRVVGIAGPGEPLANRATFEAMNLIRAHRPDLLLCLSTNGIELESRLPDILKAGVSAVSVTINTTRARTAERLYAGLMMNGDRVAGRAAAEQILSRQWRGLAAAIDSGLLAKVNSVLIPGVNADDLPGVARRAGALGARRHNIMPLIPRGRMREMRPPTPAELKALQDECERWVPQFRHCMQCRADAVIAPTDLKGGVSCAVRCSANTCTSAETPRV
jgi:nitrogen fixation protein NifB